MSECMKKNLWVYSTSMHTDKGNRNNTQYEIKINSNSNLEMRKK